MAEGFAIKATNVTKSFGDFKAVSGLDLGVKAGSITGFLGPNGAGKTTSVRMMLGLATPTSGEISMLGTTPDLARDRIGFLPEERGLYRKMTALEVIVFLAGLKGVKASVARKRALSYLEAQGLGAFAHEQTRNLSKGMSQKVQLISTLIHEPELLILDEPFSGLDPVNQEGLEQVIRDVAARGATVLFSTHVMAHAERLCEDVVMLAKGKKVFDGTLAGAKACASRYVLFKGALDVSALRSLPGITSVTDEAPGVFRLTLTPTAAPTDTLKAAFLQGLAIESFEMREPTLHDAFIVLTKGGHNA